MIAVKRSASAPTSLSSDTAKAHAAEVELHYSTWTAGDARFDGFKSYDGHDVKAALRADFHQKCGYCEHLLEIGSFEVEHYRPKGRVEGCDHSGYWWLALDWTNLLPSCPPCNKAFRQHVITADMTVEEAAAIQATRPRTSHGKGIQFPVSGTRLMAPSHDHAAEGPLLIDPTRTNPEPELKWRFDTELSIVEPADTDDGPSPLGRATIDCVVLNRSDLVQNRTQILARLKAQRISILEDLEADILAAGRSADVSAPLNQALRRMKDMKLATLDNQPFAGMARAFVREFSDELSTWAAGHGGQD